MHIEAQTVFLVAMASEREQIFSPFHQTPLQPETSYPFPTFSLSKTGNYIVETGIGKSNAAAGMQFALDHFQAARYVNVGLVGTLRDDWKKGELCYSTSCCFGDIDVTAFGYPFGQVPETDRAIYDLLPLPEISGHSPTRIVSVDSFISNRDRLDQATALYQPDCVDMELASLAHVALRNNQLERLGSIKAIVDSTNAQSASEFKTQPDSAYTALQSAVGHILETSR